MWAYILISEKLKSKPESRTFIIEKTKEVIDLKLNDSDDEYSGYTSQIESADELEDIEDSEPDDDFATNDLDIENIEENFENHHEY